MSKGGSFLSCYSCPYSTILTSGKQKMVRCALYRKTFRMQPGMNFADFCEIRAVNNPQNRQIQRTGKYTELIANRVMIFSVKYFSCRMT